MVILREIQARSYADGKDQALLIRLVNDILNGYTALQSKNKKRADDTLKRIVPLLPLEKRKEIGLQLTKHPRKSHRMAGYASLRETVDISIIENLLEVYKKHGDIEALECIAKSYNQYPISNDAEYILNVINDVYLQARIFERLICEDHLEAIRLSPKYEFSFTWGAGRARAHECLETIVGILSRNRNNYDTLGIIIWALGRLGEVDIIRELSHELE